MADKWTYDIEEELATLLQAGLALEVTDIDPTQDNVPPPYEMQPRHDGDVEESQPPQNMNGVWFRCLAGENIGQINGTCNRTNHSLEVIAWTKADQSISGEIYPNPLPAGRRFHGKMMRAVMKIIEDSNGNGLVGKADVYYAQKVGVTQPITAKPGWEQVCMSRMIFDIKQRTETGRGA